LEQIHFLLTSAEALQEQRLNPPFGTTQTTLAFISHEANIFENITSFHFDIPLSNQATNTSTISHIIGDFLPEEHGAAELEFKSMQVISREERSCHNDSDKGKV
jgi:nitrogen-specific signal transduction histidine kinase